MIIRHPLCPSKRSLLISLKKNSDFVAICVRMWCWYKTPRFQCLEGKFQSISVNFLIFYLFIFSAGMFFLLIDIEAITGDRF